MGVIITGGTYRGRKLDTRAGPVRPTSGKVREALFSALGERISGAAFVDLFAGSGAVGLEALSRGARKSLLVENHPASWTLLRANCRAVLGERPEAAGAFTIRSDALNFCRAGREKDEAFDLIFADPPFQSDFSRLWDAIAGILAPAGLAVVQFPTRAPPAWIGAAAKVKRYGESGLAFMEFPATGIVPGGPQV